MFFSHGIKTLASGVPKVLQKFIDKFLCSSWPLLPPSPLESCGVISMLPELEPIKYYNLLGYPNYSDLFDSLVRPRAKYVLNSDRFWKKLLAQGRGSYTRKLSSFWHFGSRPGVWTCTTLPFLVVAAVRTCLCPLFSIRGVSILAKTWATPPSKTRSKFHRGSYTRKLSSLWHFGSRPGVWTCTTLPFLVVAAVRTCLCPLFSIRSVSILTKR